MEKQIKILVCNHKPSVLIKNEVITPIHVGRAASAQKIEQAQLSHADYNWLTSNMIGDDTGDNISDKNEKFCEMTALYWAWKNYDQLGNPDYIGLSHYRRYFIFDLSYQRKSAVFEVLPNARGAHLDTLHLSPDDIRQTVGDSDFVIADWVKSTKDNYDQYRTYPEHQTENLDCALEVIKRDHPEYDPVANEYMHKMDTGLFCNMFVAKKEIFFEYCRWIFDILFKVDRQIDYSQYTIGQRRACGFLAERLTGIFFYKKMLEKKNYKLLPIAFITNPDPEDDVTPAFENASNTINVCFSSDNNYAPYLGVAIKSVIENASPEKNYDIFILDGGISKHNKSLILKVTQGHKNISVRFISVNSYLAELPPSLLYTHNHFAASTYYRFFIPVIFKNYQKILYLDCDLITLRDVAELFKMDMGENLLCASRDIEAVRISRYDAKFKEYLIKTLEMEDPSYYFSAGVLLFNVQQLIKENISEKLLNRLAKIGTPCWVDQCILNSVCYKRVKYFEVNWNLNWHIQFQASNLVTALSAADYYLLTAAIRSPYIVHYAGDVKPWQKAHLPLAEKFWEYARQTPFYEMILQLNQPSAHNTPPKIEFDPKTKKNIRQYRYNSLKYKLYRVLATIHPSSKKREYFEKKRLLYKERLLGAKKALRRLDAEARKNIRDYKYNTASLWVYAVLSKISPLHFLRKNFEKRRTEYQELLQSARKHLNT